MHHSECHPRTILEPEFLLGRDLALEIVPQIRTCPRVVDVLLDRDSLEEHLIRTPGEEDEHPVGIKV